MHWIMTMAAKPRPDEPCYAEDVHPSDARAAVLVDDFGDLFAILRGWQKTLMPEGAYVTAYAFPAVVTPAGTVAPEALAAWDAGDDRMIRLDYQPGGFIKIRATNHEADPQGRSPFPLALPAPPVRRALTARPHTPRLPAEPSGSTLYPAGDYDLLAEVVSPAGNAVARGQISVDEPVTYDEIVSVVLRLALSAVDAGIADLLDIKNIMIFEQGSCEPGGINLPE